MAASNTKVMSMTQIILIMIGIALVMGLVVGGIGGATGVSPAVTGAAIGGGVGFIGVVLLNKRKKALAEQNRDR